MKRCSSSVTVRETQIKTTMSYHLIPVRMSKINNKGINRCWQGCGERGPSCIWRGIQTAAWKAVWRFFKKLKIELPYDPVIAL